VEVSRSASFSFPVTATHILVANFVRTDLVYVDRAYSGGNPDGSAERPYPTVAQGYGAICTEGILNTLRIFTGTYPEQIRMDKTLRLEPASGPVRIGP
jgi:hypothetical protein